MLKCAPKVKVPGKKGEKLSDNQVGDLLLQYEARGTDCANKLDATGNYLRSKGVVVGE